MTIRNAGLGPVMLGTEQSLTVRSTGQSVSAIGDGRLEPEISDHFKSPSAVTSIEDLRLKELQSNVYQMMALQGGWRDSEMETERTARLEKLKALQQEGKGDIKSLITRHLGEKWTISPEDIDLRGGACGSYTARLHEGDASMRVTIKNFSDVSGLELGASISRGDFTVWQRIEKSDKAAGRVQEFMGLVDKRIPAPQPVAFHWGID